MTKNSGVTKIDFADSVAIAAVMAALVTAGLAFALFLT